jgi:S1-C subfamily serine protease
MGIVSAKGRSVGILGDVGGYEDFIQTDAAINMGNSGGALVDAKGRLVGVNSAILSPSRVNIGIGFAVPINLAASVMNSLVVTGTVARGSLGISTDPVTPDVAEQLGLPKDARGVVITDLTPRHAAEKAGLKRSDVIVGLNDHAISSVDELRLLVSQIAPGTTAKVKIYRGGKPQVIDVPLDQADEKPDELFTGVNVKPLTSEDRRRLGIDPRVTGLIVTDVSDDSPYRDQLVPNIIIMEIARTPVTDLATARSLVQPGRNLLAVYYRGAVRFVVVTVK